MKSKYVVVGAVAACVLAALLLVGRFYIAGVVALALAFMLLVSLALRRSKRLVGALDGSIECSCDSPTRSRIASVVVVVLVVAATTLPMGLSPIWNGQIPDHRNQYELLADSLLEGHVYLDIDVDPQLEEMENPYDPEARAELEVDYHTDHAFYNGHYYMYFGVVPVVLVFLPFKAITGATLTTYHATQLFVAVFEIGLFLLMRMLARRFFGSMKLFDVLLLFSAIAFLSVWHMTAAPALYCTAIASGVCMETLSLYFFCRAVWQEKAENRQIAFAALGALFGALAIGCRPPVAVANLLVLPLLYEYLKAKQVSAKLVGKLVAAALPYVVIGGLLLAYNAMRFDNPLEFGQTYQLTVIDQHGYSNVLDRLIASNYFYQFGRFLVGLTPGREFPGLFWQFPLLLCIFLVFGKRAWRFLASERLRSFTVGIFITLAVIVLAQCMASPWLTIRYQFDVAWLFGLLAFIGIGAVAQSWEGSSRDIALYAVRTLSVLALFASVMLYLVPLELNFTDYYWNDIKAFARGLIGR